MLNRRLPAGIADAISTIGTGSAIDLPRQMIVMQLADYRKDDLTSFEGPARFRVGLGQNFLLISPMFRGLSFDIIWSPVIARRTGEPDMEKPAAAEHMAFNFILVDGAQIVRGIRLATISPDVATAIWRARGELKSRTVTASALEAEMIALFSRYPRGIPETFFHDACDFGD